MEKINRLKHNTKIRMAFEYDYNSLNWGYIADFQVTKVNDRFLISSLTKTERGHPSLEFFHDNRPMLMSILYWETIPNNSPEVWLDCTGIQDWCEPNLGKIMFKNLKKDVNYYAKSNFN